MDSDKVVIVVRSFERCPNIAPSLAAIARRNLRHLGGCQRLDQFGVVSITVAPFCEQVGGDRPARCGIGIMPDEQEQGMARADLLLGQHPPDLVRAVAEPLQRLKLAVVVVGQGQCLCRLHADLIARQTGKRIGVQCRQPQHLLDVGQRHAEPRGNILGRFPLGAKIAISDHRIGNVHVLALDVLGQG